MKHHPGDWIWLINDGRMVAITTEAFDVARSLGFDQAPDAWEEVRARGHALGDFIVLALQVLERSGKVRLERREVITDGARSMLVYALVPAHELTEPQPQQRAKRTRRKRAPQDGPPALVLVEGGAAG